MSWTNEVANCLGKDDALKNVEEQIEEALSRAGDLANLQDLLGASSILLHARAMEGRLVLPPLGRAIEAADMLRGPDAETAVIGIGDTGRSALSILSQQRKPGAFPRMFYLDLETSRMKDVAPEVIQVILGSGGETDVASVPRYGEYLRGVYRATAGNNRPPPLLAENLANSPEAKVTVHVVAGLEDPWVSVLPDLLLDLRALLGRGARGRTVLHLLTRPSPRIRGSFRSVIQDLESSRPFDEAFVVCANAEVLCKRTAELILLSAIVPELLLPHGGGARVGAFDSYGVATAPLESDQGASSRSYLSALETAYSAAAPNWMPGNAVLLDLTEEQVFFIHPPGAPPPESAWRLCQDLIPIAAEVSVPTLCRVQRGLRAADLRLD